MVNSISVNSSITITRTEAVKIYDKPGPQGEKEQSVIPPEDKVSLNEKPDEVITYGIPEKEGAVDSDYVTLRELIGNMLKEQGITTRIADGDTTIDLEGLTPEKAQELISDNGYFGVDQTSDRIVQFAVSLSGNDPSKLGEIKAAVDKGFQMAAEVWGGTLPDISMKTYDAVMEKLNAWADGFDAA